MNISFRLLIPLKYRMYVLPVVVGGTIVASSMVLVRPWLGRIGVVSGESRELAGKLVQAREKLALLSGLDEGTLVSQLATLENTVPGSKSVVTGIGGIKKVANDAGVFLDTIRVNPGVVGSESSESARTVISTQKENELRFEVEVGGPKEQVVDFVSRLGTVAPLLLVDSVSYATKGEVVSATIGVTSFYVPSSTRLSAPGEKLVELNSRSVELLGKLSGLTTVGGGLVEVDEGMASGKANPFSR